MFYKYLKLYIVWWYQIKQQILLIVLIFYLPKKIVYHNYCLCPLFRGKKCEEENKLELTVY